MNEEAGCEGDTAERLPLHLCWFIWIASSLALWTLIIAAFQL